MVRKILMIALFVAPLFAVAPQPRSKENFIPMCGWKGMPPCPF